MKIIAYVSQATEFAEPLDDTLQAIYEKALERNNEKGIVGVLFYLDGWFVQVLEGPEAAVDKLMSTIMLDPRHKDVHVLFSDAIKRPSFEGWNMQPLNMKNTTQFSVATLQKATDLVSNSLKMDGESFVFMLQELLQEDEFQQLLHA